MRGPRDAWQLALSQVYRWFPNRCLVAVGDGAGWSLDHDASVLAGIMRQGGYRAIETSRPWPNQPAFFAWRGSALRHIDRWRSMGVSVCLPYYHGYPREGDAAFDDTYEQFRRHHAQIARVQVTHPKMRSLLLETGIAPEKVHTILLGVDSAAFLPPSPEQWRTARARLGIPPGAVVIGSFQKDGHGWGDGFEPKMIKGPDVFLDAVTLLKASVPELFVLLSGPARGFVRRGLDTAGIPHAHTMVNSHREVPALFHALDAYIVASRQEGGPKAILESMASGVPIVSTRVGQAPQLIRHGENGWLADVGDAEALARFTGQALDDRDGLLSYRLAARRTAEENDYAAQIPQWSKFFDGLLDVAS
jgi:glycosyltransferase involved in cell wall biosynthesis